MRDSEIPEKQKPLNELPSTAMPGAWLFGLGCLAVLMVYLATIAPGIFWRDSAEFVMIPFNLDVGHPAGSPTFTMLAGMLARIPLGSIAFRSNLASVLLGALAFFAFAFAALSVIRRVSPGISGPVAAAIAAAATAPLLFSPGLWYWTVAAEVYSTMMVLIALAIGMVLLHRWQDAPLDLRALLALGFLLGLGCGVHMVIILYAPAFGIYLFVLRRRDLSLSRMAAMGAAFLAGFSVFLLLPIRSAVNPPFDYGNPESLSALLIHITGRKYSHILQSFPWLRIGENLSTLPGHLVSHLSWPHLAAACAGAVVLACKAWRTLVFFLLFLLGHFYLYVRDWKADFGYLPVYLIAALFAAAGAAYIVDRLGTNPARRGSVLVWGFVGLAVIGAAWQINNNYVHCNRNGHDLVQRQTRALLDSLPPDALVVSYEDHINYASVYAQSIERWREDVLHFHRTYLAVPDYLAVRFPQLDTRPLNGEPLAHHRFCLANASAHSPFWDFGWEGSGTIDPARLEPAGRFMRIGESEPEDLEAAAAASRALLENTLGPIWEDPNFNRHDWTAIEVTARFFSNRAMFYFHQGYPKLASQALERALALRPDFAPLYAQRAALRLATKDPKGAMGDLDTGLRLDPLDGSLWTTKGQLAVREKDFETAIHCFERSLKINRKQTSVSASLAKALYLADRHQQALNAAENGLRFATAPGLIGRLSETAALSLIRLERYDRAKQYLLDILAQRGDDERIRELIDFCDRNISPR